MVNSCRECENCRAGDEQYCVKRQRRHLRRRRPRRHHHPGRLLAAPSSSTEDFVLRIPDGHPARRRPRRCCAPASPPTRRCATGSVGPGKKVAVVGLGGLGHMARQARRTRWAPRSPCSRRRSRSRRTACASAPTHYYATSDPATFKTLASTLRPDHQHVSARRSTSTPTSACSRLDGTLVNVGAPAGAAAGHRLHAVRQPPLVRRLDDRRHPRDPGDARLLRRARHRPRDRAHRRRRRSTRPTSACWPPTCATASSSTPPRSPDQRGRAVQAT